MENALAREAMKDDLLSTEDIRLRPKLSFIVSAFNRPARLRTCLCSLVDQTFEDWEILVVDNSDDPKAIVQQEVFCHHLSRLASRRIRYEHIGQRSFDERIGIRSVYTATEIGVGMTSGEWLCYPNDDSYYCPWFAERMLGYSEKNNLDLVYCDFVQGRQDLLHRFFSSEARGGMIDKTNFIYKREWFQTFPEQFTGNYGVADGVLINALVARRIRHGKLPQVLVVHN